MPGASSLDSHRALFVFVKQLKLVFANFSCMCFVSCGGTFCMVVVRGVAACYACAHGRAGFLRRGEIH